MSLLKLQIDKHGNGRQDSQLECLNENDCISSKDEAKIPCLITIFHVADANLFVLQKLVCCFEQQKSLMLS